MGAYSMLGQKKVKFWKVEIVQEETSQTSEAGTVILSDSKKGLYVQTKDGAISILEIQGENAKRMSIIDFLRGNQIKVGEKFV